MNKICQLLEEIKFLVDADHVAHAAKKSAARKMVLHPPASEAAIQKLLAGGWDKPLPPSYGEFLRATDGLENGWEMLSFLGTETSRQKPIRSFVNYVRQEDVGGLESIYGNSDKNTIDKWEKKPERIFLGNHPIIAANKIGAILIYDMRTRNSKGEMDLCWKPAEAAVIKQRFRSIEKYLEAALQEAKENAG